MHLTAPPGSKGTFQVYLTWPLTNSRGSCRHGMLTLLKREIEKGNCSGRCRWWEILSTLERIWWQPQDYSVRLLWRKRTLWRDDLVCRDHQVEAHKVFMAAGSSAVTLFQDFHILINEQRQGNQELNDPHCSRRYWRRILTPTPWSTFRASILLMWRLCSSLSLMERLPWSRWTWRPFLRNWRWRAWCGGIRIGIVIEVPTLGLPTQTLCSHDAWSAWHLRDNRPLFK